VRQVNLGQCRAAGTPIVSLPSLNPIYVNFAVPQQRVATLKVGTEVRVILDNTEFKTSGTVTALDSVVDQATRNVEVQATFANTNGKLRPGMFVQTNILLGHGETLVALPASAINYAPYGDSVFV